MEILHVYWPGPLQCKTSCSSSLSSSSSAPLCVDAGSSPSTSLSSGPPPESCVLGSRYTTEKLAIKTNTLTETCVCVRMWVCVWKPSFPSADQRPPSPCNTTPRHAEMDPLIFITTQENQRLNIFTFIAATFLALPNLLPAAFHFLLIHPSLHFSFTECRWVSVLCTPLFLLYLSISSRRPVTLSRDWGWLCSCNHCWYPCHWSSWLHSLLLTDQRCALLQVVCVCACFNMSICMCVCLSRDMWTLNFACAASIGQFIGPLCPFFLTGLMIS